VASPTQPKPTPIPAVLIYGTPTSPELTQASWFRAEDKQAAKAAAEALKFSVIDIQTDAEMVLKGSGRMIVGSVFSDVYRRIDKCARKAVHRRRVQACQHRGSSSNTGIRTNHEQGRDGHCREFFGSHNRFDCNRQ
jgi:hypothetical protein